MFPRGFRQAMILFAYLLGAYVLICLLAFVLQRRLVYFPDPALVATPESVALEWKSVFLETDDGVRIHGWYVPSEQGSPVLLFCHGNAGNISHRLDSIRLFNDLGLSVFIFDYRGYGRSEGTPSERGTYRDAHAAWRYLREEEGYAPDRIILFGRSLGSAVAIELASHQTPGGLIAEGSFPSTVEIGARAYWWLPVKLLARIRYDSRTRVSRVACPKLFIHSVGDEIAPIELGRRLYSLAPEPKSFLEIEGTHNEVFLHPGGPYASGIGDFLKTLESV